VNVLRVEGVRQVRSMLLVSQLGLCGLLRLLRLGYRMAARRRLEQLGLELLVPLQQRAERLEPGA
jgi:hypothetical protein